MANEETGGKGLPPLPPLDGDIDIEFVDHDDDRPPRAAPAGDPAHEIEPLDEQEPSKDAGRPDMVERFAALNDVYLRQRADFDNFRRRVERDRQDHKRQVTAELVGGFLPVLDNMDRAIAAMESEAPPDWWTGFELVRRQFAEALARLGVREIEAEGAAFDPEVHEAVRSVVRSDVPAGTVTAVYEKGYSLEGRTIRPAKVEVSAAPGDPSGARGGADA